MKLTGTFKGKIDILFFKELTPNHGPMSFTAKGGGRHIQNQRPL